MLSKEAILEIEKKIGYEFKSKAVLSQAFSRSSYAEENRMHGGKGLSNEQLEFYGDSVLNYIIVDEVSIEQTTIDEDGNVHSRNQEELTNFVSFWTDKSMLSRKMEELGLNKYLLLSKGDSIQNVSSNRSAKEDLVESIIGAIWFDSNKDLSIVKKVVYKILNLSFNDIYFKKNRFTVLKEKLDKINSENKSKGLPLIVPEVINLGDNEGFAFALNQGNELIFYKQISNNDYHLAQAEGAEYALNFLMENGLILNAKKSIDPSSVNLDNANNKLMQLLQLKIITVKPDQIEVFDYSTNLWNATCKLGDGSVFTSSDKFRAIAKKKAALDAFNYAYGMAGKGIINGQTSKF